MKSWAREFALGLLLATAIPPAAGIAAPSAEQILLDKVNYWRLKDRPDLAAEALQKLLSINPNNQDAVFQSGMLAVQQNKPDQARAQLAKLRQMNPSSSHIADLENAIRAGQVSPNELNEARRLAQAGQFSQAAAKYEQTFKGPPPPTFGIEYYQTLAGTPQGWPEARKGLEQLTQSSPSDAGAKLALAEVLTYHGDTRVQGIHQLSQLSGNSVVGSQAQQSWKKALMWLGNGPKDRALYNEYLAKFGEDQELRDHLATVSKGGAPSVPPAPARASSPATTGNPKAGRGSYNRTDESVRSPASISQASISPVSINRTRSDSLRNEGKALQGRGDTIGATAKYQEAIAVDPGNPWARLDFARLLAGQGSTTQAFVVVNPAASGNSADSFYAAALFYNEQNRFQDALAAVDAIPAHARSGDMAAFRERMVATAEITRAKELARAGNRAAARNILLSLNARPPKTADKTQQVTDALADIGDYQTALQLGHPASANDKKALLAYAGLLRRAGQDREAAAYLARVEAIDRFTPGEKSQLEHVKGDIAIKRADQLRERGDLAGAWDQISPLLNAYPNEPSLLLAAGRIYGSAGQGDMAMRFIDGAYQKAPSDINVIQSAVGAAIIAGDLDRARAYLAQAQQISPNSPRLYFLQAEIARAAGDNGSAVYDLAVARSLNMRQAGGFEPLPALPSTAPGGRPANLPPNPFRQSEAVPALPAAQFADAGPPDVALPTGGMEAPAMPAVQTAGPPTPHVLAAQMPRPAMRLAAATPLVASDATPTPPAPLQETAVSADSDDLVVPPRVSERPPRPVGTARSAPRGSVMQLAAASGPMGPPQVYDAAAGYAPEPREQLAQAQGALPPLPPPPLSGYQPPASAYNYYQQQQVPAPIQPYGAPPGAPGYGPRGVGMPAPVPQDSLELDIERSMNAIAAESAPTIQGGLAVRDRSGEYGLSRMTEISAPIEGTFSPFLNGQARLQAIPTFLDSGTASFGGLLRFGREPQLALPGSGAATLLSAGSQNANGVALNAAYSYQMFSGEVGTTPLGFPVENLVGRLALTWPGPGANSTVFPNIPLAPTTVPNPLQVKVEVARQAVTESVLSYAGTHDPVSGQLWGGVIKTGGDVLAAYDDGEVGFYAGGGYSKIDGRSVASNSEREGLVGAYLRPYRSGTNAFKIGVNLSYMGYDKNLRFFTFGQGGYFSPQTYVNISIPMEYSGRNGRFTYLAGGALGVQKFNENSSPIFPTDAAAQGAAQAAFGNAAFYPSRSVTGISFSGKGQLEYQLDHGFSIGGLASVDNAQNYTEVIGKLYLRKSFGASLPASVWLPHSNSLPGSL